MEKIKRGLANYIQSSEGKDIVAVLIVLVVGVGSFGLGRLSKNDTTGSLGAGSLKVEYADLPPNPSLFEANALSSVQQTSAASPSEPVKNSVIKNTTKSSTSAKNYFASSRGSKYYHLGCTGGKTLKEENKIWFGSKQEAETAGYELSSTCK